METYSYFLVPISIENLTSSKDIQLLVVMRQRGRPKTKRIQKGTWKRKSIKYRNCGSVGDHNRRRCPHTPLVNRQQQRARDREDIESSESSETSDSDLEKSRRSEVSDDSEDRQYWEESAEYDRNLARAWEIVRKQSELDSQEVELHSRSDLSELASSIFNSMEGIEMDVPTEGDVDKQAR